MLLAHLSDLHVRPPGKLVCGLVDSNAMTERALRAVGALHPRPDAVVVSGDLTDCGLAAEYAVLAAMLRQFVSVPLYVIPGNHDRRDNFRAALGHLPGVRSDPCFVQYAVDDLPVRVVMLDSVVPGASHGALCADRLAWLDRTLGAAPERPTMLVMHHPPILSGLSMLDQINLRDAAPLAAVLARHRQVERLLCGHQHRGFTGRLGHVLVCAAPAVTHQGELALAGDAGRFVMEPPAYLLHVHTADGQVASHTVLVDRYAGPFPYVGDPDYPGQPAE